MPCYFSRVVLLFCLSFCAYSSTGQARECMLDHMSNLLQLKNLILQNSKSVCCRTRLGFPRALKVASWNTSTSSDCCTWSGVKCNPNMGDLTSINLGCNPLSSSSMYSSKLLSSIKTNGRLTNNPLVFSPQKTSASSSVTNLLFQSLSKPRVLIFYGLDMSSVDPRLFSNLPSSLQVLSLYCWKLQGYFPEEVFLLPNLKFLDLSFNVDLHGHLPRSNWRRPLEFLDLSWTSFSGELPIGIGNLKSLQVLWLYKCNFSGLVPASIGNLTRLTRLNLSVNKLKGQIPPTFSNLHSLILFSLSSNYFSCNMLNASIPVSLLSVPSMTDLDLSNNLLGGHIDRVQASSLKSIILFRNQPEGSIPPSILDLLNLTTLLLSSNRFDGLFDLKMLEQMKKMETLDLSHNKITLSNVDHDFDDTLPNLSSLSLSRCNLIGFTTFVRMARNLTTLNLSSNRIQGRIPTWMSEVGPESLAYLILSHNLLTSLEKVPWINLFFLDSHSNNIQGPIPPKLPNLIMFFSISDNEFVGHIPTSICRVKNLKIPDLSNNHLNSKIPHCLGNFSNVLEVLDLQGNQLFGSISKLTFQESSNLRSIHLTRNKLERQLPQSLMNCQRLEVLDLGMNMFNDTFSSWLETMPNLWVSVLRSNHLHGTISPQLQIVDISFNKFSGLLPVTYFQSLKAVMSKNKSEQNMRYLGQGICYQDSVIVTTEKIPSIFLTLGFSSLSCEGPISEAPGSLISLAGNLSHNHLTGAFPLSKTCNILKNPTVMVHQIHNKDRLLSEYVIEFLGAGCLCRVVIGWIIEGLLCRRRHYAIERRFKFFTWSFMPTRSTVKSYFRSTKQNPETRGPFVAVAVVMILIQFIDPAASTLAFSNQCSTLIAICNIDASGPIIVQPNDAHPMEPSASLVFWAYKKSDDNMCTNMENPVATSAVINFDRNSYFYSVSVVQGYNLGVKIMALGGTGCSPAACTAKLEDCPDDLKARGPNNVVTACNPPNCAESKKLCSLYSSFVGTSQCEKPGSSDQYPSEAARCDFPIDLAIIFVCD